MQLSDLYKDFAVVLRSAPHGETVLTEKLLPSQSSDIAVADILSVTCETSILEKMTAGDVYDQPYNLFHDLKLAFGRLIAQYPQNAPEYDEVSKLFKFSIDLLVREADRLGLTAKQIEKRDREELNPALTNFTRQNVQRRDLGPGQPQNFHQDQLQGQQFDQQFPPQFQQQFQQQNQIQLGQPGQEQPQGQQGQSSMGQPPMGQPPMGQPPLNQPGPPGHIGDANGESSNPELSMNGNLNGSMPGQGPLDANLGTTQPYNDNPNFSNLDISIQPTYEDEYLYQISQGFQTIKTEIQDWNGETYWVTAANGPLFMSVNNKAPIDPRDTAVAGNVHTVKLLPHVARAPETTLGFTSPLNQSYPQPNMAPTDLLARFVHPNGHGTFSPLWLAGQDPYSTFAPSSDSAGAVIGDGDAANVWADKATNVVTTKPEEPTVDVEKVEEDKAGDETVSLPPSQDVVASNSPVGLSGEDLETLLRWTPYSFVDDDELEAAKAGRKAEHQLVSTLLLQLQALQQQRLALPGPEQDAGDVERHAALKSANLLARLIEEAKPEDISLQLDTRLPVLMRNYAGSLPAATDPFIHGPSHPFGGSSMPPQSQRLQTIAGLRSRSRATRR